MKLNSLILAILVFYQHPVLADIVTDGTVGPAQSISTIDGQLTIGQELGSLKGANLFHSFEKFDIDKGETATFTGDDAIQNVISRVTGDNKSHINGILRSEVGSADFYFINPAGVVFEENSQVDVPASFHVSTAGELIFDDSSRFSALNPKASTLTVATPEAFGFSSEQNGSLKIIGGQLRFKPETYISLSANILNIEKKAFITTDIFTDPPSEQSIRLGPGSRSGLHLNLAAIDSSTTQEIPITDLTNTQATGGELSIKNSWIDISNNSTGVGRLTIRAGPMIVAGSKNDRILSGLTARNTSDLDALEDDGISIKVDSLDLADARISSQASRDGDGGRIEIKAEQLKISGSSGNILTGADENGIPGEITIDVSGPIQIINGGNIVTTATGKGNGSDINVTAGQLTIDGPNSTVDTSASEGDGGTINLKSGEWIQLKNAKIRTIAASSTSKKAGDIIIEVPVLILDTGEIRAFTPSTESINGNVVIGKMLDPALTFKKIVNDADIIKSAQLVASEDSFNLPDSININIIKAANAGKLKNTSPELNIVGALAGVIPPNLETEQLSQNPCAHRDENSLKKIGHGGAPAFQHGENYLPINRFDESEHDPEDMDTLQFMPSINTDHKNSATECDKSQRFSLNY